MTSLGEKKNVILITADALRPDVAVQLPFLGNLIKKGSFFSNVISYQNNSTGAFYSIFSGISGNRNGVSSYFGIFDFKKDKTKLLTEYFKERGYFTIGHSMSDIILPKYGFDSYYNELDENNIPELYDGMVNEIKKSNKNFFVHFHVAVIHSRIIENVAKKFKYNDKKYYEQVEKNKKNYFKYALESDERIKNLLKNFDLDHCILVIFSDHGTSYGEHFGERFYGSLCYNDSLKTFALFCGNGFPVFKSDLLVRGIDIMPTLMEVMDIKNSGMELDGKSLMPVIKGSEEERTAFSEIAPLEGTSDYPSAKEPNIHSLNTSKYKLIYYRELDRYELYNLEDDPGEKINLYGEDKEIDKEMVNRLKKHLV